MFSETTSNSLEITGKVIVFIALVIIGIFWRRIF